MTEPSNAQNAIKFFLLLRPYWKNIFVFIICGLVLTLLSLLYPWMTQWLIDEVMLRQDSALLLPILIITLIATGLRAALSFLNSYYVSYVQHKMAYDIQFRFFSHLQRLSFSFYDKREVAEVLSRLQDAALSREIMINVLTTLINNLLYLTIVPFIVFMMNWKLALIAGFTLPWMAFSFFVLSRIVKRYARLIAEKGAEISARNFEFISGIREIQSLIIEKRVLRKIRHLYLQFRELDMKMRTIGNVQGLIGAMIAAIGTLLYTWYGATQVITGRMTVGELLAFTAFIGYLYNPLTSIVGLMVPIQEVLVHTKRFYDVYDVQPEIQDPVKPIAINRVDGHVVFSRVTFGYEPDRPVIRDVDLDIAAGKRVAIVGETGSGKSTLVSLIPRFYDPQSGSITIDGIDIGDMSLDDLRSQIGLVMQMPHLFVGTLEDNITCGRKGFDKKDVIAAARSANCHDFISALPDGYHTAVGEKGVTLSGGELQRVAMARVFLLDRPILILDEATSALDQQTESLIQGALKRLTEGRTTFVIAHRLTTVQDADIILVLQDGKIVEQGNHESLLEEKGYYHRLYRKVPES